jgi:hypothetical protein
MIAVSDPVKSGAWVWPILDLVVICRQCGGASPFIRSQESRERIAVQRTRPIDV